MILEGDKQMSMCKSINKLFKLEIDWLIIIHIGKH